MSDSRTVRQPDMPPTSTSPRAVLPKLITASTYESAMQSVQERIAKRSVRRVPLLPSGHVTLPRLTNGEVITLVMAIMAAAGARTPKLFPFWYQFAAAAYGWSPERDELNTSAKQAARWFPEELLEDWWRDVRATMMALDMTLPSAPRLDLDGRHDDPVFAGEVRAALVDDGAEAQFKIPLPACKDPKTGKPTTPKRNPKTGKWECNPVTVDDPVTVVKKKADNTVTLVLLILGAWALFDNSSRRHRRT